MYGRKITSKTNGNSIFLPAAGCRDFSYITHAGGLGGHYWSASLYESVQYGAQRLYFNSSYVSKYYEGGTYGLRYSGLTVRAVRSTE